MCVGGARAEARAEPCSSSEATPARVFARAQASGAVRRSVGEGCGGGGRQGAQRGGGGPAEPAADGAVALRAAAAAVADRPRRPPLRPRLKGRGGGSGGSGGSSPTAAAAAGCGVHPSLACGGRGRLVGPRARAHCRMPAPHRPPPRPAVLFSLATGRPAPAPVRQPGRQGRVPPDSAERRVRPGRAGRPGPKAQRRMRAAARTADGGSRRAGAAGSGRRGSPRSGSRAGGRVLALGARFDQFRQQDEKLAAVRRSRSRARGRGRHGRADSAVYTARPRRVAAADMRRGGPMGAGWGG